MTTHEVLVAARNLIDREGHDRGTFTSGYCVHTAIGSAAWLDPGAAQSASNVMFDRGASVGWNDAPERTKEEVLAAFDEAINATAPAPADPFTAGPVGRASFREPVRS